MLSAFGRYIDCMYFTDNYKYMGMYIVKNDRLISIVLSISSLTNLAGRVLGAMLYKKLGLKYETLLLNLMGISISLGFIFFGYKNAYVYILLGLLTRMMTGFN